MAVRKPEAAEVHGKQRDLAPADGARGGEQRAVAAQHDDQVAALRHVFARQAVAAPAYAAVSSSQPHCDAALLQPLDQLGHQSAAPARTPGLETMPTVLMMGIQQKLLVAFGAEDGAFHDAGFESELLARRCRTRSQAAWWSSGSRTMPPLPTWPLPTSNCGLISITICPSGWSSGTTAGRIRVTEMKLTSQTIRSTGSPMSSKRQLARVDALVQRPRADRCAASRRAGRRRHRRHARARRRACSRQSVKPPVDEPTSRQTRAGDVDARNARSAAASLSPPRLT